MLKKVDRHGVWMYIACPARLARHLLTPQSPSNTSLPLMLPLFESSSTGIAYDDDGDDDGNGVMPKSLASYSNGVYQDFLVETAKELRDKEALVDHGYRMILQVMRNSQRMITTPQSSSLAPPMTACDLLFGIEHCLLMAAQRVQGTVQGTSSGTGAAGKQRGDTLISGTSAGVGSRNGNNGTTTGSGVGSSGVKMVNQNASIWRAIARFTKKLHARRSPLLQGLLSTPHPLMHSS